MNESERRRRELLRQTRKLYDENISLPAVHPRYGNIIHELYETDEQAELKNSFFFVPRSGFSVLSVMCV